MQIYGIGERYQFVEHFRARRQFVIVGTFLVQQSDGFAITALCVVILLACPVQIAQFKQQHTFLYTVAHRFLVAFLVGGNGIESVAVGKINVSYGIVDLVKIVLVVVRGSHAAQPSYHLTRASAGHDFRLGDAGIELHLVRRALPDHTTVCLVGRFPVAQLRLKLSHEIPHARFLLLAAFVPYGFRQIGGSLFISVATHVKSGVGIVPVLHGTIVHRVTPHLHYHVLGVVEPVQ